MATLQAARAHALGLTLPVAKSWGLNRAIYYAAAKRGFVAKGTAPPRPEVAAAAPRAFFLGDDKAYQVRVDGKTLFTIGGEVQTPEAFKKQIEQRFAGTFRQAWAEGLRIVRAHTKAVLESPQLFYGQVYRPRRDDLAKKWTERAASSRAPGVPKRSHRA
jgi:hypothetical protein